MNNNQNLDILEKRRKTLSSNAIVLLIVSIIAIVVGVMSSGSVGEAGVNLFFRGFVYSIMYIILLVTNKEAKKFVGGFSIFTAIVVIIWSGFGGSLIDIALVVLSISNIIYSIKYLNCFKDNNVSVQISSPESNTTNYYRLGSLVIVLLSPLVWFLSVVTHFYFGIVLLVVMNIVSIVLCVISTKKSKQSTLLYILMVISILIVLAYGPVLISDLIKGQNSLFGD